MLSVRKNYYRQITLVNNLLITLYIMHFTKVVPLIFVQLNVGKS